MVAASCEPQPRFFRDPGQVPWPRAGWPGSEGGKGDFRETSQASEALRHGSPPPATSSASTTAALVAPGCTPSPLLVPGSLQPLCCRSHSPVCPPRSTPLLLCPNSSSTLQTHFHCHLLWKAFPDSLCASTEHCAFSNHSTCQRP